MKRYILLLFLGIPTLAFAGKVFNVDGRQIEIIADKTFRQQNSLVLTFREPIVNMDVHYTQSLLLGCKSDFASNLYKPFLGKPEDYQTKLETNLLKKPVDRIFDRAVNPIFRNKAVKNYLESECKKPSKPAIKLSVPITNNTRDEDVTFLLLHTLKFDGKYTEAWLQKYKVRTETFKNNDGTLYLDKDGNPIYIYDVEEKIKSSIKYQVQCGKSNYRILSITTYAEDGSVQSSAEGDNDKFNSVVPDSIADEIYTAICSF